MQWGQLGGQISEMVSRVSARRGESFLAQNLPVANSPRLWLPVGGSKGPWKSLRGLRGVRGWVSTKIEWLAAGRGKNRNLKTCVQGGGYSLR